MPYATVATLRTVGSPHSLRPPAHYVECVGIGFELADSPCTTEPKSSCATTGLVLTVIRTVGSVSAPMLGTADRMTARFRMKVVVATGTLAPYYRSTTE